MDRLEDELGSDTLWVQGVGGRYYAAILDNLLPNGTAPAAIEEMTNLFHMASEKCPSSKIAAAGYRYVIILWLSHYPFSAIF